MNRMPWLIGVILALVAGLAIGFVAGSEGESPARGPLAVPIPSPPTSPAPGTVDARAKDLEREVADLKVELARKTKEADEARAALAARMEPAPTDPLPTAATPDEQRKSLEAVSKGIDELAKKGLFAFMSPENKDLMAKIQ